MSFFQTYIKAKSSVAGYLPINQPERKWHHMEIWIYTKERRVVELVSINFLLIIKICLKDSQLVKDLFIYLRGEEKERVRLRKKEKEQNLIPKWPQSWCWTSRKPGARNYILVSHMSDVSGRMTSTYIISCGFHLCITKLSGKQSS